MYPCSSTGQNGGLLSRKSWFESRQGYPFLQVGMSFGVN